MLEIVKRRYIYFAISLFVIVPGILGLIFWGLPTGIDFTGGSLMEVSFESGLRPSSEEVVKLFNEFDFMDAKAQVAGDVDMIIRSQNMEEYIRAQIVAEMNSRFEGAVTVQRFESVGPSMGKETAKQAASAVALAAVAIMIYITYAFRQVKHAFRYGVAAIIAMLHDVLVVVGIESILGHFLNWEVDSLFLTALLTVIGFSVHDTVVVFDRIRENDRLNRRLPYEELVNRSIVQTLARSINTQLTVMITLLSLAIFGGSTIRHFVVILLIGVFSGTYSSIFNAAPILVVWENKEWRYWFKKKAVPAA